MNKRLEPLKEAKESPTEWKAALAANTRERRNGRRVVDCGGKGRVARDIATYECSIYRVENEHDVVIVTLRAFVGCLVQNPNGSWPFLTARMII